MRHLKLVSVAASFALAAGVVTTVWAQAKAEDKKVEGELVDMSCFTKGGAKGDGHAACGEKCLKSGVPAGILVDGKVMTIAANPVPLAQYAGRTIRIEGKASEEAHAIVPTKLEVKKDDKWEEVNLKEKHEK
jgi:hypothetical protein